MKLQKVEKALNLIKKAGRGKDSYVFFSGGKDSLAVLSLAKKALSGVEAIHVDTTVSIPKNLKYVRSVCKELGVKLHIVRPEKTFFELAVEKGFPTFRRRWCCDYLKLRPVKKFMCTRNPNRVCFDGQRREESVRRETLPLRQWRDYLGCYLYHPILDWTREDVEDYLKQEGLPINPLYAEGFRRAPECWCGLYKSPEEFLLLKSRYPDFFSSLLKLENSMHNGGSLLYCGGRRVYLRDLDKQECVQHEQGELRASLKRGRRR
jgi:phosphoadenosine phosphosulfate reductase